MSGEPGGSAVKSHVEGRDSPGEVRWTLQAPLWDTLLVPSGPILDGPRGPRLESLVSSRRRSQAFSPAKKQSVGLIRCPRPWFRTCSLQVPATPRPEVTTLRRLGLLQRGSSTPQGPTGTHGGPTACSSGDTQVSVSLLVPAGLGFRRQARGRAELAWTERPRRWASGRASCCR